MKKGKTPSLQQFRNWCRPKAHSKVAFSSRKCHLSMRSKVHVNSETALIIWLDVRRLPAGSMRPFSRFAKSGSQIRRAPNPCANSGKQGREGHPLALVPRRVRHCRLFLGQQLRQHLFRAQMVRLALFQLFFSFHAGGDGQEAIEAARVVAAIFVLCATVHGDLRKYPLILAAICFSGS